MRNRCFPLRVLVILVLWAAPAAAASALDEGMALYVSGDFEGAKERLAAHLASNPDDPTALYHLGRLERDGLKAKSYFERLIETRPGYPAADMALLEIGLFYAMSPSGLSRMAREEFQRMVRDYPRSPLVPQAHYRIGLTRLADGDYPAAREEFRKAIQADAKLEATPLARAYLAESYLLEGDYGAAVREAEDGWSRNRMESAGSRLLWIAAEGRLRSGDTAGSDSLKAVLWRRFPDSDEALRAPIPALAGLPPAASPPLPHAAGAGRDPASTMGGYLVQIGIFGHTARARALLERLRSSGLDVRDEPRLIGGKRLWIFTAGPYADPAEARRVASDIDRRERLGCRVAEIPPAPTGP